MQTRKPTKNTAILDATAAELRRAVPANAVAVQELTRKAYAQWIPVIGREPMPMKADYDAALREHLVDLLYVEGRLAALIETIPQADHLLIENVAVLPTLQGCGLGRRLMAHAEALAMSLGLPEMRLYTNKQFATNVRLYLALGYRVDREEPFMRGTTFYMSKPLGQSPPTRVQHKTAVRDSHEQVRSSSSPSETTKVNGC
jgi:ribosomal protein S18 acetylase RimI-like enzyme